MLPFFPTELVAEREQYQQAAKLDGILALEVRRIRDACNSYMNVTKAEMDKIGQHPKEDLLVLSIARLPSLAGQVALSNGEFVRQTPDHILSLLNRIYSRIDTVNAMLDSYSLFSHTAKKMPTFRDEVFVYYDMLNDGCSRVLTESQEYQDEIGKQLKANEALVAHKDKQIQIAKWAGITILLASFIVTMVVAFVLLVHS